MSVKAVILAAGLGARLCPLTPFIPKEMLPIGQLPAIHHVLSEVADAGVDEVMIVLSKGKESLLRYLSDEITPKGEQASRFSEQRRKLLTRLKVCFAKQRFPLGTADAIRLARDFMGDEPLAVLYPDDLLRERSEEGGSGALLGEMIRVAVQRDVSVVAACEIPGSMASQYGVLRLEGDGALCRVSDLTEKPSDYREDMAHVMIGRFVISPRVMASIPRHEISDRSGIIPALLEEASIGRLFARVYRGQRYDIGSHQGYREAMLSMSLE